MGLSLELLDKVQVKGNIKNPLYAKNLEKIENGKKDIIKKYSLLVNANRAAEGRSEKRLSLESKVVEV